ncbi:MAG: MotA/TolQ/ExbB proton channel family protein [Myxococcota bacterium]
MKARAKKDPIVTMIESLTEIMVQSGAAWVLWLLIALSVLCVAVALERVWVLRSAEEDMGAVLPALRTLLREQDLSGAEDLLNGRGSVAARIVAAGLAEAEGGPAAAKEALAAASGLERRRLEKRLIILGTVGNNAPFVGLLGTVIGVVGAFDELGKPAAMSDAMKAATSLAPERVMSTIAEALVATAVGLIVAIPAVASYNYFQNRINGILDDGETLGHLLLSHLEGRPSAGD